MRGAATLPDVDRLVSSRQPRLIAICLPPRPGCPNSAGRGCDLLECALQPPAAARVPSARPLRLRQAPLRAQCLTAALVGALTSRSASSVSEWGSRSRAVSEAISEKAVSNTRRKILKQHLDFETQFVIAFSSVTRWRINGGMNGWRHPHSACTVPTKRRRTWTHVSGGSGVSLMVDDITRLSLAVARPKQQ